MLKSDIMSFSMDELCQEIANLGEKSFRAKQIYEWLHIRFAAEFSDMTNLSKDLRDKLNNNYVINMPKIVEVYKSKIDGTRKYLGNKAYFPLYIQKRKVCSKGCKEDFYQKACVHFL